MSPDLPLVMADPEALKRALGNLIDNAAEAMQQSLLRELRIGTALLESGMVELTRCRYGLWSDGRDARAVVSAVFLDQAAGHGAWAGDCGEDYSGAPGHDSRGEECAGGCEVHRLSCVPLSVADNDSELSAAATVGNGQEGEGLFESCIDRR